MVKGKIRPFAFQHSTANLNQYSIQMYSFLWIHILGHIFTDKIFPLIVR